MSFAVIRVKKSWTRLAVLNIGSVDRGNGMHKVGQN